MRSLLEELSFMMLEEATSAEFATGGVVDAHGQQEVLLCLTCTTREEVDAVLEKAVATGGKPWKPTFGTGPVYGGSFQDPDGHVWELMHLASGPDA